MLGCHSDTAGRAGRCRDQWPADNGTACLCYGTVGYYERRDSDNGEHRCIATCADDIQNHHVSRSDGAGLVTADCPEGTTVLGCGSASPIDGVPADSGDQTGSTDPTNATHSTNSTSSTSSSDSTNSTGSIHSNNATLSRRSTVPTRSSRAAAVVAMGMLCRCYNDHRVKCYAACGRLVSVSGLRVMRPVLAAYNTKVSPADRVCPDSRLKITMLCVVSFVLVFFKRD